MAGSPQQVGERHIIGPDTGILDGVFLARAAIVVDYAENPDPYRYAYSVLDGMLTEDEHQSPLLVARAVNQVVRGIMPFSGNTLLKILQDEADERGVSRVDRSHEIGLSRFIFEGGICHQQALLGGALLELFQERTGIEGEASVDPPPAPGDYPDRHVWVRYTRDEERVIIDTGDRVMRLPDRMEVAGNQFLAEVTERYLRPEELAEAA